MTEGIDVICFGEMLWDNMPDMRRVGGAPLNVCYHLNKNGVKSQMVSQVGSDADGEELLHAIEALDVDSTYVRQSAHFPTSRVEVEFRATRGDLLTELNDKIHTYQPVLPLSLSCT